MSGHVENYQGYAVEGFGPIVLKIYNDLGSAISKGGVYFLSYEKDADSLSPSARTTVVLPATSSVYRQVVVALDDIADAAYGLFMYRGDCPTVLCAATIVAEDYLKAANASATSAEDGTTQTASAFGIAKSAYVAATTSCEAYLFGLPATVA
jgi:hypothetical protein